MNEEQLIEYLFAALAAGNNEVFPDPKEASEVEVDERIAYVYPTGVQKPTKWAIDLKVSRIIDEGKVS